jgi:hypothetical protein
MVHKLGLLQVQVLKWISHPMTQILPVLCAGIKMEYVSYPVAFLGLQGAVVRMMAGQQATSSA